MKKRAVIAISGGVDSSVAALLLRKSGYDLTALFFKFWSEDDQRENACCSFEAEQTARSVAQKLKIPFYSINLSQAFKKAVVDDFIAEYQRGQTPNPCVVCNRLIKFKNLEKYRQILKADFIATGHYAQIKKQNNEYQIWRGQDKNKDQTYFLWDLPKELLPKIIFPVGQLLKKDVYQIAKKEKLPTATRPESQQICFISQSLVSFLEKFIPKKPGLIKNLNNEVVGQHQGLAFYTIGQREGLNIDPQVPQSPPLYVIKKDLTKNVLYVGQKNDLFLDKFWVKNYNFLTLSLMKKAAVQIRYQSLAEPCLIEKKKTRLKIIPKKPLMAITPGQSAVFFQKERLLGGGVIALGDKTNEKRN